MLSRSVNGINWMEGGEELFSLTKNTEELGSLSNFMSMLEDDDWYLNNNYPSSSSSYPFHENQFQTNNNKDITFSSLLNAICTNNNPNPFQNSSNFGYNSEFLPPLHLNNNPQTPNSPHLFMDNNTTEEFLSGFTTNLSSLEQMGTSNLTSNEQFTHLTPLPESITNVFNPTSGFEDSGNSSFLNLCTDDDVGGRNLGLGFLDSNNGHGGFLTIKGKMEMGEEKEIDGSDLNYGSDEEGNENTCKVEDNTKNCNGSVKRGDHKGKKKNKKGLPAKNLMAERRRRKKLNDRLYMLRSIIPKISKMDRASILGDAIDYLKELLQRINGLNNELELSHSSSSLPSNLHPLTHPPMLPSRRVKEELCPSSLAGPNGQSTMVEVKVKEGRDVNIHMFCGCRPGLLFSTMKALDNLGLDIEQAVVSCFDGFSLDIFHAELPKEGNDILPEQIEAILVNSAGVHQRM